MPGQSLDHLFSEQAIINALDRADDGIAQVTTIAHNTVHKMLEGAQYMLAALLGNRATVVGYALIAIWQAAPHLAPQEWKAPLAALTAPIGILGAGIAGYTGFGLTVGHYYRLTAHHIQEHGRLDPRFAEAIILGSENRAFTGYCQQQGLYLAARDYGHLDVFEEVRQAYSNVRIPHF
jgi:hypothetical protein